MVATAVAPALTSLGVDTLAAHLFLFYFASLSAITPPVAVASYAAAGIAQENPMKVGFTAVKIGITGFILPFAFALNNDYIIFNFDFQTLLTWISGIVVSYSLGPGALQGYVEDKVTIFERIGYLIACGLAITPYVVPSIAGWALFGVLYGFRQIEAKRRGRLLLHEKQIRSRMICKFPY